MLVFNPNTLTGKELEVMPEVHQDWITERIDEARKGNPVPKGVALTIKAQLQGTMREHALRPSELTTLANALLDEDDTSSGEDVVK